MVRVENDRIIPINEKLVFQETQPEGEFQRFYLDTIKIAESRARKHFFSSEELFFNSVFAIPTEKLPELKLELRALLLRFVQSSEDPDGKSIMTLVTALTKSVPIRP
jgi:hypothetical protein